MERARRDPGGYINPGQIWTYPIGSFQLLFTLLTLLSQTNLEMAPSFRHTFLTENGRAHVTQFNPTTATHSRVDAGSPYPTFEEVGEAVVALGSQLTSS